MLSDDVSEMPKNWNRRFKHNRDKIKTGDIYELAEVVRNLAIREQDKGLSTGEKQMYTRAKKILASELMYALEKTEDEAEAYLDQILLRDSARPATAGSAAPAHEPLDARSRLVRQGGPAAIVVAARQRRRASAPAGPRRSSSSRAGRWSRGRSPRCARAPACRARRRRAARPRRRRRGGARRAAGDFPLGLAFVEGGAVALGVRPQRARGGRRRRGGRRARRGAAAAPAGAVHARRWPRSADADAAIAAARVTDTIKEAGADGSWSRTLDRSRLWAIQTPQAFRARRAASARSTCPTTCSPQATDDAWLVERAGGTRARRRVAAPPTSR